MSLFDYLNNDNSISTSSGSSTASQVALLLQQAQSKQGIVIPDETKTVSESSSSTSTSSQPDVLITVDAVRANAAASDAKTQATTLAGQIRTTLDTQYAGKTNKTPNMTAFSGRALAIVALNDDGSFSKAEAAAAKAELRERDRAAALTFLHSADLTAASLKGYTQQLLAARKTMSAEEQALRDSNPHLR